MLELYSKYARVGTDLVDLATKYQGLADQGLFAGADGFSYRHSVGHPLNRALKSCDSEYRILFAGAFSSGKSLLINALLGAEDLLPVLEKPLTGVVTYIRSGTVNGIHVKYLSKPACLRRFERYLKSKHPEFTGEITADSLRSTASTCPPGAKRAVEEFCRFYENYDEYVATPMAFERRGMFLVGGGYVGDRFFGSTEREDFEEQCSARDQFRFFDRSVLSMIDEVVLEVKNDRLPPNITLVDSPGLDAMYAMDEQRTLELLKDTDAIVVVSGNVGQSAADKIVKERLRSMLRASAKSDGAEDVAAEKRAMESVSDRVFFVWNKMDQVSTGGLDANWPALLEMVPPEIENPQIRCTSALAFFDRDKRTVLREQFGQDGGGCSYAELRAQLTSIASDSNWGGVESLRRDILEFAQTRAHFHKLEDIRLIYKQTLRDVADATRSERHQVEVEYQGSIEELKKAVVRQHLDLLGRDLLGYSAREHVGAGRVGRFEDVYIHGRTDLVREKDPANRRSLPAERNGIQKRIARDVVLQMRREFQKESRSFRPTHPDGSVTYHDCLNLHHRLLAGLRQVLVDVGKDTIASIVSGAFQEITAFDESLARLRAFLPRRREWHAESKSFLAGFRDNLAYLVGARIHEEASKLPSLEDKDAEHLKRLEGESVENALRSVREHFEERYLGAQQGGGWLPMQTLPRIMKNLPAYLAYECRHFRDRLVETWKGIVRDALSTESLAALDLRELLGGDLVDSEHMQQEMGKMVREHKIMEFAISLDALSDQLTAVNREFDQIDKPMGRPVVDWKNRIAV